MKMLLVLFDKQGQILLCRNPSGYSVPTNGAEVDEGFGFGSPQEENRWFWENCGLLVYRRYICFYKDYCAAVFELYGECNVGKEFIWMDSGSLDKFIVGNSLTVLLKAVVKNYNCSKTVPWVNKDGFQPYLNWALKAAGCDTQLTYGKIEQIKNTYVSTIFRFQAGEEIFYLKIPGKTYLNDAVHIEKFLVNSTYGLPEITAVYPDGNAFLAKAMGGHDLSVETDMVFLEQVVEQWADMQQRFTEKQDAFSSKIPLLHNYTAEGIMKRIDNFPSEVSDIFAFLNEQSNAVDAAKTGQMIREVKRLLSLLAKCKVPDTLCHGDLRPGNIRVVNGFCFLYDWGMGMYGHPFYDVVHFLHVTRRQLSQEMQEKIKNTYLKQWEMYGTGKDILRNYETVERLKDFFMVLADADWLMETIEAVGGKVPEGSMDSWLLMRRVYYFRRVLGRFLAGDNN